MPENHNDNAKHEEAIDEENLDLKLLFDKADYKKGESIFKKCSICKTINKGEKDKIGPNLWNVINSKVASNK